METKQKITIYSTGDFFGSVNKFEGTLIDFGVQPYAQYDKAPFVSFIPKGKRKGMKLRKTYQPYLVVLKGENCPDPKGAFGEGKTNADGVTIKKSVYMGFDERYKTDFDAVLNEYIKLNPDVVLMDFRHTQSTEMIANKEPQELTVENASTVSTIVHKNHPDWGTKKFNYKGQPLNDGEYTHTWGSGSNSALLHERDFHFWHIVTYK